MHKMLILGCGHWGRNYVRLFSGMIGSENIVVADPEAKALDTMARQFRGIGTEKDPVKACRKGGYTVAVVATPAARHYEMVKLCLAKGADVLAEKPLTLDVRQAEKLADMAASGGRILMVGHTFLYNPAVRKVRDLLDAGTCGDIYYMKATRTHLGLIRPDVNAIWDLAPHDVSIFNYLIGAMPLSVSASGGCFLKKDKEDVAFINLRYPGNILGHIHVSWTDSNKERTLNVVGSKARIVFDDLNALERVKIFEKGIGLNVAGADTFGEFLFTLRDGDIISPKVETNEPLLEVCKEFISCVESRKKPRSDAATGVDVVRVMVAIQRSLQRGGATVQVGG